MSSLTYSGCTWSVFFNVNCLVNEGKLERRARLKVAVTVLNSNGPNLIFKNVIRVSKGVQLLDKHAFLFR